VTDAVIVIRAGRIEAIGPRSSVSIPSNARRIDAANRFLIPGLMDANVHLILDSSIEFMARYEGRFEELIEEAAQISLRSGLTTVFDSWGPLQPLITARDRIARGEREGARMFVAGNIVGFSGPFGRDFNVTAETVVTRPFLERINGLWEAGAGEEMLYMTPEGVRDVMRRYVAAGPDFVKYGASGHRDEDFLMFSPEAQRVIVEETHRAGIIAQTHTTSVESLRQAIEAGNDMLQHCSVTGPVAMPDATIELLKTTETYCAVQPRTMKRLEYELQSVGDGPRSVQRRGRLQVWHENEVRLIRAGAPLLLATDAGVTQPDRLTSMTEKQLDQSPTRLGEAHFLWLEAMAEKGMKPMDAIVSATRNIAAAYNKLDEFGTLEAGKLADIVILDADPLQNVSNVRRIHMVLKDGRVIDRERLPLAPVLTAGRAPVGVMRGEAASMPSPTGPRILVVTDLGEIEIELDSARAPITVTNFLRYVDGAFFDGGRFFRVVRADNQPTDSVRIAVVQGGVAQGRGREGFPAIPLERTSVTGLGHRDGTISMARGGPDTATSSFFLCIGDQPSLDFGGRRNPDGQGFAAFGQVVRGMDVARRIHEGAVEGQNLVKPIGIVSVRRL
jgi:imidazolonepropionase-like amidohydrolase/cyclophilin family peptidyl-prolyl cis-trans isomerase